MKIYNEIVIDMNPESSSYGDTLYEDSFEYSGPMALALNLYNLDYPNQGNYRTHYPVEGGGWMVRTDKMSAEFVAVTAEGEIIGHRSGQYTSVDTAASWAKQALQSWGTAATETEAGTGVHASQQEVAPNINYSEFSQFIDKDSGAVTDQIGFINYLKTLPGMSGKNDSDIQQSFKDMPNLSISEGEQRGAQGTFQADVYGLQKDLGTKRGEAESEVAITGVYDPTSTGFGAGDTSFTSDIYGSLSEKTKGLGEDIYDLENKKENELLTWIESIA